MSKQWDEEDLYDMEEAKKEWEADNHPDKKDIEGGGVNRNPSGFDNE